MTNEEDYGPQESRWETRSDEETKTPDESANDNSLQAEYDKIKAAQEKEVETQKRFKEINDIVFARGMNAEERTEKLVTDLKLSYSAAAEVMKEKPNEDQFGNITMRPGISQAERQSNAKNIRMYDGILKKLADKLGITHVDQEQQRRANNQSEGQTPG